MNLPKHFRPFPFGYHQIVDLRIDSLSNLGHGVGRIELPADTSPATDAPASTHDAENPPKAEKQHWVVMVPFALPGEQVRAKIWRNHKNYSEADLVEILEAAPERREPKCELFGRCGGCQYQHYAYSAQLEWKRRQVEELLEKLAGIQFKAEPTHPSPVEYAYRSKLTPHFQKPRKPGTPMPIGFQHAGSRRIIDVPQCPIATQAINDALPAERDEILSGRRKFKRGGTLLLRDTLEGVITDNNAVVSQRIGDKVFQFIAGEFFQNNPFILPEFVGYGVEQACADGIRFLVDAYCGVGSFALSASSRFEKVAGIEVSGAAITYANANAKINGVDNCEFRIGSAEGIFENLEFPADETAVLIDPPRAGCDGKFITQLCAYSPKRLVYVSCGPDTQARDIKLLMENGYRLVRMQPFDLFPQTRHIETIATLERVG